MYRKSLGWMLSAAVMLGASAVASAQSPAWPSQPVRLVVPFPAGGGVDHLSRLLADKLGQEWGQSVVVVNRPGGSTIVGTKSVVNGNDDHTLLLTTDATFSVVPQINPAADYRLGQDFEPVALIAEFDQMIVGKADYAGQSLTKLLEAGKAGKPYTYASYGTGSEPQLAIEMLKHAGGVEMLHVPYKGVPQALNAVVAGEVDFTTSGVKTVEPFVKSGRVVPLAFTGERRDPLYPDTPTTAELGLPEVKANVVIGIFAPTGLSPTAEAAIRQGVSAALADPDFVQRAIRDRGFEKPVYDGGELATYFKQRADRFREVITIADIKAE